MTNPREVALEAALSMARNSVAPRSADQVVEAATTFLNFLVPVADGHTPPLDVTFGEAEGRAVLRVIREAIRSEGGNVQRALGVDL